MSLNLLILVTVTPYLQEHVLISGSYVLVPE
jgi:hypothetical protein